MTRKSSDTLGIKSRKDEFTTSECITKRFQVQQEVNSEFNLEDVNVNLNLTFLN